MSSLRLRRTGALGIVLVLTFSLGPVTDATGLRQGEGFVQRHGSELRLDGRPFRFTSSNNYYPMYKSKFMVDDLCSIQRPRRASRVMQKCGARSISGTRIELPNSIRGKADGVYFQYWDAVAAGRVQGRPDGLERLDYVMERPGELTCRLVIPLVNNWNDFGGMDLCALAGQGGSSSGSGTTTILYRSDHAAGTELDQPAAQPVEQLDRCGVQGRPGDHDLGAGQRAALPERRGVHSVAELHHPNAGDLGRRDVNAISRGSTTGISPRLATRASLRPNPAQ